MNFLDNSLIISIIGIIFSIIVIFIIGDKIYYINSQKKAHGIFFKFLPLIAITVLIVVIFAFHIYYNQRDKKEIERYKSLKNDIEKYNNQPDTLLINDGIKLKTNSNEIQNLINKNEKQKFVTGSSDINLDSLKALKTKSKVYSKNIERLKKNKVKNKILSDSLVKH